MIAETMEIVRKYNMGEIAGDADHVDRSQRVPASTRILQHICEIEKKDKALGDLWMAELHEFAEWVKRRERRKISEGK